MTLYHVSSAKFKKFKAAPLTFFFDDIEESMAMLTDQQWKGSAYMYKIEISDITESNLLYVGDDEVNYDLIANPSYQDCKEGLIGKCITSTKKKGYVGLIVRDYSAIDPQNDMYSIALFPQVLQDIEPKIIKSIKF